MALCAVSNLTKYFGADLIFEKVTFEIEKGQRIGLIGSNGVGKTTLLRMIMGKEDFYSGNIFKRQDVRLDYLDQIPKYPPHFKTLDVLYVAFKEIFELQQRLIELEHKMIDLSGQELEKAIEEYGRVQHLYEQRGGYAVNEKLNRIVIGLNIDAEMQKRSFNLLSGGEKSRVVLGRILLEEPDILLLDEPSNHLDINYMSWLENYLQDYSGAVVIISHDRYFLNRAVNKIIELSKDGVEQYDGNYSYYQKERQRRLEEKFRVWQAEQKRAEKLEQQIERYLIWARSRDSEKMFKRAKELKRRLAKLDVPDKPQMERKKIRLNYTRSNRSGREVMRVEHLGHGFSGTTLFSNLNLTIYYQDRIGIIGANGAGKSTLIKLLIGQLEPMVGSVKQGSRVKIGYLPQEVIFANSSDTLIEAFQREHKITVSEARHELARVLFTEDDVFKTVNVLSGGERSRLKLCMLMYSKANVLVLDEPTNHLDIESREILEESLQKYQGTLIFVSHDRYFLDKMATVMLEINKGHVNIYNGDYQYYLEHSIESLCEEKNTADKDSDSKSEYQARKAQQSKQRRLRRQLEQTEVDIAKYEEKLLALEKEMVEHAHNVELLQELYDQQNLYEEKLIELIEMQEEISKLVDEEV